jgi:hypothetical protein
MLKSFTASKTIKSQLFTSPSYLPNTDLQILLNTTKPAKMPLVVPGITTQDYKSNTDDWMNRLVGKKLGERSDATVCIIVISDSLHSPRLST